MHQALVDRAKQGDGEAFDALARIVGDRCMAIACRILRDADLAEDAVQAALIVAWRELRTLRDPDRFEPWLHRIVTNECYSEAMRRRRRSAEIRLLPVETHRETGDILTVNDRDQLERAFRRLTLEQRAVLVFHHYLGLTLTEVADHIGIPVGTAKSRLHHATNALRASLEADARTPPQIAGATRMTAPRDPDRLIKAFLAEGQTELPDRAYDAVRDSIDHTRQRVVIGPWREPRMSNLARVALAAVAVLVVAVVGINFLPRSSGPGGGPASSPTLSPSPSPVVLPDSGDLEPDTRYFIEKADVTPARFTLSVPAGWETISYAILGKTDGGAKGPGAFRAALSPWLVSSVYADPCKWMTSAATIMTSDSSVDDLASALSGQAGRNGSAPTDVTLGGYSGKKVDLSVPDDFDQSTCDGGDIKTWNSAGPVGGHGGYVYGAGQRNTVYILDVNNVDGRLLVLDTMYLPNATAADKAELQAIVDSISIEP